MKEKNEDSQRRNGDLESLRARAADELEQEEAGRRADSSAQAAVNASAARLGFEARMKDQARDDAEFDQQRRDRETADEDQYERLLKAETEAVKQADEDARDAGRPAYSEQGDEAAAGDGSPAGERQGAGYPADGTVSPEVTGEPAPGVDSRLADSPQNAGPDYAPVQGEDPC